MAAPPPKSPEPLRAVAKVVKAKRRDKAESKPIVQPIVEAARKPKIGCAGLSVLTEGAKQVAPASDPNYDPQIQLGNIARVDVPNRKLYGPKACVDLPGSPMARALQHMQDGGLYGQDKIAKFGNFESIEGLKTMMDLSRTLFKRAGLSVWSDKINMRLEAAAELGA